MTLRNSHEFRYNSLTAIGQALWEANDMPEFIIDSRDDARLNPYRDLKQAKSRPRETFIAEGEKLVLRLLDSPCRTESVLCTSAMHDRLRRRIPAELPIYVTTTPVIYGLIGFHFH